MRRKCVAEIEREFRKSLINNHKKIFGKGPEEAWVKVNRNIITFSLNGAFSPLEEYLWTEPQGKQDVKIIRQKILEANKAFYIQQVEEICNSKFLTIVEGYCEKTKNIFGALLIEDDLEN
ncbi:MAG: Na-translocating system protein MpsC family protein [Peptococcaceae bacterium]